MVKADAMEQAKAVGGRDQLCSPAGPNQKRLAGVGAGGALMEPQRDPPPGEPAMTPKLPPPTFDDVTAAAMALGETHHRTPVLTSRWLNQTTGARVFIKAENFQRTGSFKFRGAYNAVSQLDAADRQRGVIAFSSGNHAQGLALAARLHGIPATIVMPSDAPALKQAATRDYGATVVLYDRRTEKREEVAAKLQAESGAVLIPPFDHPHVIAGQGTAALELIEDVGNLDALFVCVGGGGLISGCALATRHLLPRCAVFGVEPEAGDDATRSFKTKTLQRVDNPATIADGAQTACLGSYTFPLVLENVSDMMTVSDSELRASMRLMAERFKVVAEPTGVLGLAGFLKRAGELKARSVGIILSGGNVDLTHFGNLIRQDE